MYLTPASVGYLTQFVLAVVITGFFAHRILSHRQTDRPVHTLLLACLFASLATLILLFFLDAALPPSPRLYAVYLGSTAKLTKALSLDHSPAFRAIA